MTEKNTTIDRYQIEILQWLYRTSITELDASPYLAGKQEALYQHSYIDRNRLGIELVREDFDSEEILLNTQKNIPVIEISVSETEKDQPHCSVQGICRDDELSAYFEALWQAMLKKFAGV